MKKTVIIVLWSLFCVSLQAQHIKLPQGETKGKGQEKPLTKVDSIGRYVKSWHVDARYGEADSCVFDTATLNYQDDLPLNNSSIAYAYNGNLGSLSQSRIFFDRIEGNMDLWYEAYAPYLFTPQNTSIFDTKTPISMIEYRTTTKQYREEDNFNFLFTVNKDEHSNFGVKYRRIYARGQYNRQGSDVHNIALWGSYYKNIYEITGLFTLNRFKNAHNGGLTDRDYVLNPDKVDAEDLDEDTYPINLEESRSQYYAYNYYVNQKLNFGFFRKEKDATDSIVEVYVPVTSIIHTFNLRDSRRTYLEKEINTSYYPYAYNNATTTDDNYKSTVMVNTLAITMDERYNKLFGFGLKAYLEYDYRHYTTISDTASITQESDNGLILGGEISRQYAKNLRYRAGAELDLTGHFFGDFNIFGTLETNFKLGAEPMTFQANAKVYRMSCDMRYDSFVSNHSSWTNQFDAFYAQRVGGRLSFNKYDVSIGAKFENSNNYIYMGQDILPHQDDDALQVLQLDLKGGLHFGWYNWENTLIYQQSSDEDVLPLPRLSLYSNMYYKGLWVKVLTAQIGVSCQYNTSYYGSTFDPSTGLFYNQTAYKVGHYPLLNVYANFKVRSFRFFVQYENMTASMLSNSNYFSMDYYPLNTSTFQFGISWLFYD